MARACRGCGTRIGLFDRDGFCDSCVEKLTRIEQEARAAIVDDALSEQEETRLDQLIPSLGLSWETVGNRFPDLLGDILLAKTNDGRLDIVSEPHVITKRGEVVHVEAPANLMKEHQLRELRGGYSGFSFPIGKTGIRYRIGGFRGRSEVVGTELVAEDAGILAVTSKRVVFLGGKKTIEMPYTKLVGLNVFSDGLRFHLSNRQRAPLFQISSRADVLAAIIHVAMQRASG
jgi:hypothetical protein